MENKKDNRIICGDCLEVMKDIPDKSVDCIVTSPPYYKQLSYESNFNSYLQYIEFITKVAKESFRVLKNDSYFFLNFANDKTNTIKSYEVLFRFLEQGFTLHDTIIWYRYNSQPVNTDRQLTPQYEFIFMMCKYPSNYHLNKSILMEKFPEMFDTKNIGNVWKVAFNSDKDTKISMKKKDEDASNGLWGHSGYPVRIAEAPILMTTKENDIVLDMFMGSGTTAYACKKNNRNYIGIEISPEYIDIINKRLNTLNQERLL